MFEWKPWGMLDTKAEVYLPGIGTIRLSVLHLPAYEETGEPRYEWCLGMVGVKVIRYGTSNTEEAAQKEAEATFAKEFRPLRDALNEVFAGAGDGNVAAMAARRVLVPEVAE